MTPTAPVCASLRFASSFATHRAAHSAGARNADCAGLRRRCDGLRQPPSHCARVVCRNPPRQPHLRTVPRPQRPQRVTRPPHKLRPPCPRTVPRPQPPPSSSVTSRAVGRSGPQRLGVTVTARVVNCGRPRPLAASGSRSQVGRCLLPRHVAMRRRPDPPAAHSPTVAGRKGAPERAGLDRQESTRTLRGHGHERPVRTSSRARHVSGSGGGSEPLGA